MLTSGCFRPKAVIRDLDGHWSSVDSTWRRHLLCSTAEKREAQMLSSRCVSKIDFSHLKTEFLLIAATAMLTACAEHPAHESAGSDHYGVAEVGSFHIGGRQATLSGLPTKEIVFTAGAAPFKVDPNGEFEVEQMYVQYVKLFGPYARAKYPLLMWHGGGL